MIWTWLPIVGQIAILAVIIYKSRNLGRLLARRDMTHLRESPQPPVNIQLLMNNGKRIAVDSELSPMNHWQVILPAGVDPVNVVGMEADALPPRTKIELNFSAER